MVSRAPRARATAALLLWLPVAASAAGWSADQAVAEALVQRTGLLAVTAQARAARAAADTMAVVEAPTLKVSADRDQAGADAAAKPARYKFELDWAPPRAGEPELRRTQRERLADMNDELAEGARQRLAWQVRQAHASALALERLLSWSREALALQAQLLAVAEQQSALGRRTRQELVSVRQQLAVLEGATDDVVQERLAAQRQLRRLTGRPDDAVLPLPVDTEAEAFGQTEADEPPAGGLLPQPGGRPELRAADARCAAVLADTRLKRLDNGRWLKTVTASYSPRNSDKAAAVGMQLELILPGSGDRQGSEAALAAQYEACVAERAELAEQLAMQASDAAEQLDRANRAARLQRRQLARDEESLVLVQASRAQGRADDSEVLAAKVAVAQAHQQVLRRELEARLAALAVRHAAGQSLAGLEQRSEGVADPRGRRGER